MVKHTRTNCLSVFDHLWRVGAKGLINDWHGIHCLNIGNKSFHEWILKLSHRFGKIKKWGHYLVLATIFAHITNFKMQKYFNADTLYGLEILSVLNKY